MLFCKEQFTGFIDFDLVETNIRLFDPCYCSMSILPDHFQREGFSTEWLDFLGCILSAYHAVNPLTSEEMRSVWVVLIAIEALFVALFANSDANIAAKNAENLYVDWRPARRD